MTPEKDQGKDLSRAALAVASAQPDKGSSTSEPKRIAKQSRILIVEDEPNVRLVFQTALQNENYRLDTAEDGEVALEVLKSAPADMVLLDLQMPRLDGMSMLRKLRESGNNVPVAIITAHGSIPDAVAAMRLGAVDFLSKPVTPEALRHIVSDVLARHVSDKPGAAAVGQPLSAPATLKAKPTADPAAEKLAKAKLALNHRHFDEADTLLAELLGSNPKHAEAHYLVGVLHELRGERHAAYSSYRAALQAQPDYEPARLHLIKYFDDRLM